MARPASPRDATYRVKDFKISLDRGYVLFRGFAQEPEGQKVAGIVTFQLSEPTVISAVNLHLIGASAIAPPHWTVVPAVRTRSIREKEVFLNKTWNLWTPINGHSETLRRGTHCYPFDCDFPGHLPPSIEGLLGSYLVYRFVAKIERAWSVFDESTRHHFRIIRTIGEFDVELSEPSSIEDTWRGLVRHKATVASKGVAFSTKVPFRLELFPLKSGIEIGAISVSVMEIYDLSTVVGTRHRGSDCVVKDEFKVQGDCSYEDDQGNRGWLLEKSLQLPGSLGRCVQDSNAHGINIHHHLAIRVEVFVSEESSPIYEDLEEEYGMSEPSDIRIKLPVFIYLDPDPLIKLRIEESQDASVSEMLRDDRIIVDQDNQLGRLWEDINVTNFETPRVISTVNTPGGLLGRTPLASATPGEPSTPIPHRLSPELLDTRLQELWRQRRRNMSSGVSSLDLRMTPGSGERASGIVLGSPRTPERASGTVQGPACTPEAAGSSDPELMDLRKMTISSDSPGADDVFTLRCDTAAAKFASSGQSSVVQEAPDNTTDPGPSGKPVTPVPRIKRSSPPMGESAQKDD
ncbi:MAG: hypothetical protein M1825_000539 [Sarcosagium campestre]|nr:MAG: hypothetical protein M1825_000539 [Sarcosagium campestre]